jgi:hypothetical protein
MLADRGVHLPYQMQRYLTDKEKASGTLAFDAAPIGAMGAIPGPLSSDPNAALPWMLTSAIDPEIIRVIFSPLDFADILGERKAGDWTEQTRFFPLVEARVMMTSSTTVAPGQTSTTRNSSPTCSRRSSTTANCRSRAPGWRRSTGSANWVWRQPIC